MFLFYFLFFILCLLIPITELHFYCVLMKFFFKNRQIPCGGVMISIVTDIRV